MANVFQEKSFEEQQRHGRETMAQQEAELEQTRFEAAQKKTAAEQTAQEAAMAANFAQEREAERLTASIILRQQADETAAAGQELAFSPTTAIDQKIARLERAASGEYVMPYLFLTAGAATVDILQAICNFSLVLSFLASGCGLIFSVMRHYGLKYANPGATKAEHDQMLNRTIISGAVSLIPLVDVLPEQTMVMIREWTVKRLAIIEANKELTKLKAQRQKMMN